MNAVNALWRHSVKKTLPATASIVSVGFLLPILCRVVVSEVKSVPYVCGIRMFAFRQLL